MRPFSFVLICAIESPIIRVISTVLRSISLKVQNTLTQNILSLVAFDWLCHWTKTKTQSERIQSFVCSWELNWERIWRRSDDERHGTRDITCNCVCETVNGLFLCLYNFCVPVPRAGVLCECECVCVSACMSIRGILMCTNSIVDQFKCHPAIINQEIKKASFA